jgi:hypothetical protein
MNRNQFALKHGAAKGKSVPSAKIVIKNLRQAE